MIPGTSRSPKLCQESQQIMDHRKSCAPQHTESPKCQRKRDAKTELWLHSPHDKGHGRMDGQRQATQIWDMASSGHVVPIKLRKWHCVYGCTLWAVCPPICAGMQGLYLIDADLSLHILEPLLQDGDECCRWHQRPVDVALADVALNAECEGRVRKP